MVVNNETSKVYQTVFISGELTFVRKPAHGHKIIVLPMYILAVAASGTVDIHLLISRRLFSHIHDTNKFWRANQFHHHCSSLNHFSVDFTGSSCTAVW